MDFNVFKINNQLKELQKANQGLIEKNILLEKDLKDAQDTIGNFMVEKENFDKQIETINKEYSEQIEKMKAEYEKQIEDLKTTVVKTETSVGEEAARLVASVGVPTDTVKVSANEIASNNKNVTTNSRFKVVTINKQ